MTREQLQELFQTYLNRQPTPAEYTTHGRKTYNVFRTEISNCKERLALVSTQLKSDRSIKIGIILTGHVRKMSILQGIRNWLAGYDYDVFVHTWDNIGLKGRETNIEDSVNRLLIQEMLAEVPNLKNSVIENNKQFINSLENKTGYFNYSSPEPFIKSQLYSINKGFMLLEEYSLKNNTNYDVVFRFRFDSDLFLFNLPKPVIEDLKNNTILFVPNTDNAHSHPDHGTSCWACDKMYYDHGFKHVHVFEHTNVICDLYAYGSQASMKKYCNLYTEYDNILDAYKELNLKMYEKVPTTAKKVKKDYHLLGSRGHVESLYYYYCSYPERLLQLYLRDYMLVESRNIKLRLVR